jgi:hypothetical protein
VVFVVAIAVGTVGVPTKVGDEILAGVNVNAVVTSADVSVIAPVLVLNADTPDTSALTCDITNAVVAN